MFTGGVNVDNTALFRTYKVEVTEDITIEGL